MPRIKQLSAQEAQKIAAGEVVERPANVVKELIENALDAGATAISIYIQDSGKTLIRVVDNGFGMNSEDAQLCFAHHATSKITSVDDLPSLTTFGFRGEALSSISAVSKVTLITKGADAQEATHVVVHEGKITAQMGAGNTGTDMSIADLFYNVPARKKFLKTNETEWRQILVLFQACVLDYTAIHFKLFSQGALLFNCPPSPDLKTRIAQLWDHTVASHMITIPLHEQEGLKIEGIISNHLYTRYDRSSIFFLVNKRWVKNHALSKALLKGYLNVLPPDKFPLACFNISVDPATIDVNIHPRKEEILFLQPRIIENKLTTLVKQALENNLSAQLHTTGQPLGHAAAQPTFFPKAPDSFQEMPASFVNRPFTIKSPTQASAIMSPAVVPNTAVHHEEGMQQATAIPLQKEYHIIGQFNKTYILIEQENGLFLVDQHAAHERILYEQFSNTFEHAATIELMFPPIVELSSVHMELLALHQDILSKNNIIVEPIGKGQLLVKSVPIHAKEIHLEELIKQVIAWIEELNHVPTDQLFKKINEKLHAQMACKAAIKAGDTLTTAQIIQLLQNLEKTDNRFTCPHGRPTGWLLSLHEIEKKFKRI
jgi:DNA mismatch repair protein MutL